MNTGIGDAVNLDWKLAHVLQGRADRSLLDSYDPERIGFARSLVSATDRAFTPLIAEGLRGELTRKILAPFAFSVATRFTLGRHEIFRIISQTRIHYPDSPLSEGKAGDVHGGDRLPWAGTGAENNFAPLRSLDWQAHVYGEADESFTAARRECGSQPTILFSRYRYRNPSGAWAIRSCRATIRTPWRQTQSLVSRKKSTWRKNEKLSLEVSIWTARCSPWREARCAMPQSF